MLADVRKTALGAGGLLVLAVLFVDPSGMGGKAVHEGAAPDPGADPAARPGPRPASNSGWFMAREPEPEAVAPALAPGPAGPPPQAIAPPDQIRPPRPVGPDFPPELGRRHGG